MRNGARLCRRRGVSLMRRIWTSTFARVTSSRLLLSLSLRLCLRVRRRWFMDVGMGMGERRCACTTRTFRKTSKRTRGGDMHIRIVSEVGLFACVPHVGTFFCTC